MRIALLSLVAGIALANTPSPTIPTPYPTLTPAPESQCSYAGQDKGPFALDCLQLEFTKAGCSPRGDSYPTNADIDAKDKAWYNAQTWQGVKDGIGQVLAVGGVGCYGASTPTPTADPTNPPTTLIPTPQPTLPPTLLTPAPTYAENAIWQIIVEADATGTAKQAKEACEAFGYNRQYDATKYVIALVVNGGIDYYSTLGTDDEICNALGDPSSVTLGWSDRVEGPFAPVTITGKAFSVMGAATAPDGRQFATWDSPSGTGAFASSNPATGVFTGADNQPYEIKITSLREYEPCRERMSPLLATSGESATFEPPCGRTGTSGQVWDDSAVMCDGSTNMNFLYAAGNRQHGTCDSLCVWSLDYDGTTTSVAGGAEYWFWDLTKQCWKRTSEYFDFEFHFCQVDDPQNRFGATERTNFDFAQVEKALLCMERCDLGNGWVYAMGSCYRVSTFPDYNTVAGTGNVNKGLNECNAKLHDQYDDANLASIASYEENAVAMTLCEDTNQCYFGGISNFGQGSGAWADSSQVTWTNWDTAELYDRNLGTDMVMLTNGKWSFLDNGRAIGVLCETVASTDDDLSYKTVAKACAVDDKTVAAAEIADTRSYPALDVTNSGFTDAANPGNLHIVVTIPKTMYNPSVAFENSTNDIAEYSWQWTNSYWETRNDNSDCSVDYELEGAIPWTEFNLGGAGGVERIATWEDQTLGNVKGTRDDVQADGSGVYYQFGATIRIRALQPLYTEIKQYGAERAKRETYLTREVVARVPFVLRFQKTITVTTDVNIVSTKYNYKTIAAIIQSVQHSTQYFEPPYAKIMMQIRTKSQYPYLLDKDTDAILHVHDTDTTTTETVTLALDHLRDDINCTFTNSDHMREGDICTQEWMLHITPKDNVCYGTGEYSIEYTTGCFYGKDVCYRPVDSGGVPIDTVTFTFKVQTSKFCPMIADEVDLTGTLAITGRESFKPTEEGVEGPSNGQMYMQGESIHFLATTASTKAKIINTEIAMVELQQDMATLVQTGYNRVPFDSSFNDKTIWMKVPAPGSTRVADGTVNVNDGVTVSTGIVLMTDSTVYQSGENPCVNHVPSFNCELSENEAGFILNLHSRAMPVNVDSFGTKTIQATLEVTYEAVNNAGGRRRRLLNQKPSFDMRASASFGTQAWAPHSIPQGMGTAASMSLKITLSSTVDRSNALSFSQAVHAAIVQSLNAEAKAGDTVYDQQVVVDKILSGKTSIWTRTAKGQLSNRRLLNVAQELTIEFTFANIKQSNAMLLTTMLKSFDRQLRNPSSTLMNQPIFLGAVVHDVREIPTSDYIPVATTATSTKLASSAVVAMPSLFALLALLW